MRTTKLASIFVYLFFYSTTASADSPITINTTIDKAKVTTGDIITYTITMKHALDVIPNTPDFNAISKFNIIGYPISEPKEIKKGVFEQKYSVELRADQVGTYNISPIRIPFKVKEKNTNKYISENSRFDLGDQIGYLIECNQQLNLPFSINNSIIKSIINKE